MQNVKKITPKETQNAEFKAKIHAVPSLRDLRKQVVAIHKNFVNFLAN